MPSCIRINVGPPTTDAPARPRINWCDTVSQAIPLAPIALPHCIASCSNPVLWMQKDVKKLLLIKEAWFLALAALRGQRLKMKEF